MKEAWHYILGHPGCSEHVIRINYGYPVMKRMIDHKMIRLEPAEHGSRVFAEHEWYQNLTERPYGRGSAFQRAKAAVGESTAVRSVPCPKCKADSFWRCTQTYGDTTKEIGPHYERLISWSAAVLTRYSSDDLDFDVLNLKTSDPLAENI